MAGRADYQDRKDAKNESRRRRAEQKRAASEAGIKRSSDMLPDNGQPILVGHHSEGRHRRDLERSNNLMRASIQESNEAQELERRADASENSGAISSDDPDALPKLRVKLAGMEAQREKYKAYNKLARKEKRDQLPSYMLTNLAGNIRRVKQRIEELEAAEKRTIPADRITADGEITVHWDVDTNRVQVFSPKPASREEREARSEIMRRHGFVWAHSETAWQRQAHARAWHEGLAAADAIEKRLAPTATPKTLEQVFDDAFAHSKNNPSAWGHE